MSKEHDAGRGAQAAGGAIGALVGAAAHGPEGAVLGAIAEPYVIEVAARAWRELAPRRQHSLARLIGVAADDLGEPPGVMVDDAMADEGKTQHLHDAMHGAAQTVSEEKVDRLAYALAAGLRDDGARLDEANLVLRAMTELEPIHIRALAGMRHTTIDKPVEVRTDVVWAAPVMATLERLALIRSDASERQMSALDQVAEDLLNYNDRETRRRESRGPGFTPAFFKPTEWDFEARWLITPFGKQVLSYVDLARERRVTDESRPSRGNNA